jgi:hypothetical protein
MTFCTIITPNYIHYALALRESLLQFTKNMRFYIFISEISSDLKGKVESAYNNTHVLTPIELDD